VGVEVDVDVPRMGIREALEVLRSRQKTTKGAPAYSRFVNRKLGRLFAAAAYRLGRTPNQVTAVSALCTFAGIAVIALFAPTVLTSVGAAALLVIGYALDAADGQLARLRGGGSVQGEWLDHVVDAVKIATLHTAVLIQWFRFEDRSTTLLLIPLGFQVVSTVLFFTIILNDQLRRAHRGTTDMLMEGDGRSSWVYSLAVMPTDYGLLCVVLAFQFWIVGFTWIYGLLFVANAAFLVMALVKWFREAKHYSPSSTT
jgi:phosphatidylglycerophosphate synthase